MMMLVQGLQCSEMLPLILEAHASNQQLDAMGGARQQRGQATEIKN